MEAREVGLRRGEPGSLALALAMTTTRGTVAVQTVQSRLEYSADDATSIHLWLRRQTRRGVQKPSEPPLHRKRNGSMYLSVFLLPRARLHSVR
jgi:hypothetical protein